ncbi:Ionotropic receptor [Operophtera brumata]|uniref:Ionotropic receptor n=1 Tax=Operophtera brumata TaxID=104452 RepID=A0A0L7LGN1_OPEBR|nr:Ionotropic receptor [Operophtera brumata]
MCNSHLSTLLLGSAMTVVAQSATIQITQASMISTDHPEVSDTALETSSLALPTVLLQLDAVECCKLIGARDDCECPSDVQRKQLVLSSLLQLLTEAYSKLDSVLTAKVHCEDPQGVMNSTRERLYKQLAGDTAGNESIFYWDASKLDPETGEPTLTEDGQPAYEGYCIDLIERLSEETDMAVSALTMTAEREEVIDFVPPDPQTDAQDVTVQVHDGAAHGGVAQHRGRAGADGLHDLAPRQFTLKESFWFALTSFTPQGGGEAPKALSGRTLVAAYWLFVTPVSSLEQLARQSRINYTVVEASTIHQYFINMKFAEDTLYRVWKEITLNATSDQSQYRVFAEQPYAIAVQQGSRLQEDLSRALLELQKERFLEQLGAKYWNESARQSCPDADESEGITLESLGGVFIATLFGLGLAMVTLAWEVFYYKRKEKNKVQAIDNEKPLAFADTKKSLEKKVTEGVAKFRKRNKKNVTIGDKFKPVKEAVSYISVYPKGEFRP